MENAQLQNVKTQLAGLFADLRDKRANPFKGTALEALTEEIRTMRKTFGLPYKEIASKLTALKVDTTPAQVSQFCKSFLKTEPRRGPKQRANHGGQ